MSAAPESVYVSPTFLTPSERKRKEQRWNEFVWETQQIPWQWHRLQPRELAEHDAYMSGKSLQKIWNEIAEPDDISPLFSERV